MGGLYHEEMTKTRIRVEICTRMERGLAYAEACFETFRIVHGELFAWAAHMQRLQRGMAAFGYQMDEAMTEVLYRQCLQQAANVAGDALVRLTVSVGAAEQGLMQVSDELIARIQATVCQPRQEALHLHSHLWPWALRPRPAKFTADYAQMSMLLHRLGTTDVVFAHEGMLLAGAVANVLIYRHGQWWTPPAERGVLPGVIRGHLIAAGVVREAPCPAAWLHDCDALALSNSGMLLQRVDSIDGRELQMPGAAWSALCHSFPPSVRALL